MFATIRRYDAIDQEHTAELVKKADETLVPSLSERVQAAGRGFPPGTAEVKS